MRLRSALIGVGLAFLTVAGLAQAPAARLAFEVASIKPADPSWRPSPGQQSGWLDGGRYVLPRIPVRSLIIQAFRTRDGAGLRPEQILGAPDWANSTFYAVDAKVANPTADPVAAADHGPLIRSLLEDRFKLAAHFEKRDQMIHALVLAKANGTLGPHLTPHPMDCLAIARDADEARRNGQSTAAILAANGRVCMLDMLPDGFHGTAVELGIFAALSGRQLGMEVVDRTGLTGTFDLDLHFAPEAGRGVSTTPTPSDFPSISTALEEQLGLKIETRNEPGDVLVIDHIEHPTED